MLDLMYEIPGGDEIESVKITCGMQGKSACDTAQTQAGRRLIPLVLWLASLAAGTTRSPYVPRLMSETTPIADRLVAHVATLPPSGIREFFELAGSAGRHFPVSANPISPRPTSRGDHLRPERRTSYTSNYGPMSLREEISKYIARLFGPVYRPDNEILITVGVSEVLTSIAP